MRAQIISGVAILALLAGGCGDREVVAPSPASSSLPSITFSDHVITKSVAQGQTSMGIGVIRVFSDGRVQVSSWVRNNSADPITVLGQPALTIDDTPLTYINDEPAPLSGVYQTGEKRDGGATFQAPPSFSFSNTRKLAYAAGRVDDKEGLIIVIDQPFAN